MATPNKGWIAALVALGAIVLVVVALRASNRPLPPPAAPPSSSAATCGSSAACGAGFRCVVPGVCSRACSADADCPAGRRCAELRLMEGGEEPNAGGAPALASTCVLANPG
jgi:hypothetical protein